MAAKKQKKNKNTARPAAAAAIKAKTASPPRDEAVSLLACRAGWLLLALTAAAILFGVIESTWKAGLAIPGWPNSFRNLWIFCPFGLWFGAFDVFVAQTHRLLGYAVAATSVVLVFDLWKRNVPMALRSLALVAMAAAPLLAASGGLRIAWEREIWGAIHAGLAVAYLALVTVLGARIARARKPSPAVTSEGSRRIRPGGRGLVALLMGLLVLQVVAGTQLRHVSPQSETLYTFLFWVWIHTIVAAVLIGGGILLLRGVWRRDEKNASPWRSPGLWFGALLLLQLLIGPLVWIFQFGFPLWFLDYVYTPPFTPAQGGGVQIVLNITHVVTGMAAVAVGAFLLFED